MHDDVKGHIYNVVYRFVEMIGLQQVAGLVEYAVYVKMTVLI